MKRRPALLLTLALLAAGCAHQSKIRPPAGVQLAPTPAPIAVPTLVAVKQAVPGDQAKAAKAQIQDKSVTGDNIDLFLEVAQWEYNQGHYSDAEPLFQKAAQDGPRGVKTLRAQYMTGECYAADKQYLASLSAFQKVLDQGASTDYGKQARQRMEFLLKYSLDAPTLEQFSANYPGSSLRCETLFQLGRRQTEAGQRVDAVQTFRDYLSLCPSHAEAADAKLILQGLTVQGSGRAHRIGVLAPLTGSYALFGKSMVEGVKLALERVNQSLPPSEQIEAVIRDTGGDSVEAVKAARTLIQQDGVIALLGPVTGAETAAVAAVACQEKIPILCPAASRDGLSTLGPYVFRNSMTNEIQGRTLARYAVEKMGLKSFAILNPQDAYGEVLADSFRKQAEALGATITASGDYPPNATDFRQVLTDLGGRNPSLDKDNERENQRREQQFVYSLKREFLKSLLPVTALGSGAATLAVGWAPFAETLGNTLCPGITQLVSQAATEGWANAKYPIRNTDLVTQALTRLTPEAGGNTEATSTPDDPWGPVLDDLQANLLVTGTIQGEPLPKSGSDQTWDYVVRMETHYRPPDAAKVKTTAVTLTLSEYKMSEFLQAPVSFQGIYLPAHTNEIPLLVSQLRFYGLRPQLLGGHLWENESVIRDGGDTVDGAVFVTGFWADSPKSNVKDFTAAYSAKFGRRPDLLAAQAYDAARLLAQALQGAQSRDEVRNHLSGINGFDGVSGGTSFNGGGGAEKLVPILKIDHGRLKQLQ